ncbi:MAG: NAD(P)H-hydrate dehydratase [Eubacterium sp.]
MVGKDAKTVVSNGQECYINDTGNNGMATGGSGDVLAGMTAGLLAQKMDSFEAAKLAVYLHGAAGDVMKEKKSSYSLLATDLLEGISELLSNLEA